MRALEVSTVLPISQTEKLRLREEKGPVQHLTAGEWNSQDLIQASDTCPMLSLPQSRTFHRALSVSQPFWIKAPPALGNQKEAVGQEHCDF